MRLLWIVALAGCDMVSDETVVDELRVVSLRTDAAVFTAEAGGTVRATVHDPDGRPVDVLLWTCTGDGCAEAGVSDAPVALSAWTSVQSAPDAVWEVAPPAGVDLAASGPAQVWALACTVGTCPVIDAVRADPTPGSDAWRAAVDQLADAFDTVASLPIANTSAAFRVVPWVALPPGVPAPPAPSIVRTAPEGALTIPSGGRLALRVAVDAGGEAVTVYPSASDGGFVEAEVEAVDGEAEVTLVAGVPDDPDRGPVAPGTVLRLWIHAESATRGAAMWQEDVTVGEP